MAYDWKTMPSPRRLAWTLMPCAESKSTVPPSVTRPSVGRSRPATARRVVVFPQPEGPSRVNSSPACTSKSTPPTAYTRVPWPDERLEERLVVSS